MPTPYLPVLPSVRITPARIGMGGSILIINALYLWFAEDITFSNELWTNHHMLLILHRLSQNNVTLFVCCYSMKRKSKCLTDFGDIWAISNHLLGIGLFRPSRRLKSGDDPN